MKYNNYKRHVERHLLNIQKKKINIEKTTFYISKVLNAWTNKLLRVSPGKCPDFRQNVLVFLGVSLE
jgi:hypothetical protein